MGFSDLKNALKKVENSFTKPEKQYSRPKAELPSKGNDSQKVFSKNEDIMDEPISTDAPSSIFKRSSHHQLPVGCDCGPSDAPIQTNNFYNNLALEDQTFPIWTQPYSLWLTKDKGQDVGFAFNQTEDSQKVFGPDPNTKPAQFYFNPPKIKSFVFSGENFNESNISLKLSNHAKMSVTAKILMGSDSNTNITFPLVQGMGFITAIYNNITPIIASQVGVQNFLKVGSIGNITKYRVQLFNQVVWSMYCNDSSVEFSLKDSRILGNKKAQNVMVQFCRGESEYYDNSAGLYVRSCNLAANLSSKNGKSCKYYFNYATEGKSKSGKTIIWCLPHHQEVLDDSTKSTFTQLALSSTTKGIMRAYNTNVLVMEEPNLPIDINWEPWSSVNTFKGKAEYLKEALSQIKEAAQKEVEQDVVGMANIDSMYTSGKILDKFAYITYVCHFILKDPELTGKIFPKITKAIEIFSSNQQIFPLIYDTTWKGLISSADPGADFGNANYNDHHFHNGYHIHAIAMVAFVDQSFNLGNWFKNSNVKEYVSLLIRDVANPSRKDPFFPEWRSFDFFNGHSFAHGIFASGDGKDEESSSEDYHFAYGMKLYAKVTEDKNMEARANLMLAIMRRAMNMYMLFSDDNKVQPPQIIGNKVAGITFENKVDFATYFGRGSVANEWIHGIHMLPITPISSYIRLEKFVQEEWVQILGKYVDRIPDGWKGILMLNLALFDPKASWKWFTRNDWNDAQIDNGMSKTWSLAYIAGVGGA